MKRGGLDELRVRGQQKISAYAEKAGLGSAVRLPDDKAFFELLDCSGFGLEKSAEALLDHFRNRSRPNFFKAFADPDQTRKILTARFQQQRPELLARAEKVTTGKWDLLGLKDIEIGQRVDWHFDPVAGKRAPMVHWSDMDDLDADIAGDKKVTWELNRHQHLLMLGRAYWVTSNEEFAATFGAHLQSWMEQNPPKLGINWVSSLELALRSISWIWAFHFFRNSQHLTSGLFLEALKFLYVHARHLETYLSTYFSPNTHLTGEALGLFYIGTVFPEFRESPRWRSRGHEILDSELERHVLSDGVYFEQSSYYHRYTTDFYTHYLILLKQNETVDTARLEQKFLSLLDHLMYITRPDGTTPFYGDDDGGRLLPLDERAPNDFRAALSNGAVIFKRADYKYVAGELAEETFWLCGSDAVDEFEKIETSEPPHTSRAFEVGGYYVMRDGWKSDSNYLLIDCGPHGSLSCGHSHADALSIEVAARGKTFIVDPGTYTYTGSALMRNLFRSSASHNTLTIDGESSSETAGPFSWKSIAKARAARWYARERFDFFEGEHDGYMRLKQPAKHRRRVLFLKNLYWVIIDDVETMGEHECELNFHFLPGSNIEIVNISAVVESNGNGLKLFGFADEGKWDLKEGWFSATYLDLQKAPVISFIQKKSGPQQFVTFLIPGTQRTEVQARWENGARIFEIGRGSVRDQLIIGAVNSLPGAIDCEVAWLSFVEDSLAEFTAIGCLNFDVAGAHFKAQQRTGFVSAAKLDRTIRLDTDANVFSIRWAGADTLEIEDRSVELLDDKPVHVNLSNQEQA